MLAAPGTDLREAPGGFIITCAVCDEAEILTLAVAPDRRRGGVATALLAQAERHLAAGGTRVLHLEVSTENTAALALYERAGYTETGRRKGYYRATDHRRADAVLMAKRLVP